MSEGMQVLTDEQLLDIFNVSKELRLEESFIRLLQAELERRNINFNKHEE